MSTNHVFYGRSGWLSIASFDAKCRMGRCVDGLYYGITGVSVDRLTKYAHFGSLPTSFNAHKVAEVFLETMVKQWDTKNHCI